MISVRASFLLMFLSGEYMMLNGVSLYKVILSLFSLSLVSFSLYLIYVGRSFNYFLLQCQINIIIILLTGKALLRMLITISVAFEYSLGDRAKHF